jgi:hypothetical protein
LFSFLSFLSLFLCSSISSLPLSLSLSLSLIYLLSRLFCFCLCLSLKWFKRNMIDTCCFKKFSVFMLLSWDKTYSPHILPVGFSCCQYIIRLSYFNFYFSFLFSPSSLLVSLQIDQLLWKHITVLGVVTTAIYIWLLKYEYAKPRLCTTFSHSSRCVSRDASLWLVQSLILLWLWCPSPTKQLLLGSVYLKFYFRHNLWKKMLTTDTFVLIQSSMS